MVNIVGKRYFEVDRAYIAGFFDGDGAIMAVIEKHKEKRYGFRIRVIAKLSQSDDKTLLEIRKRFGFGYVKRNLRSFDWIVKDQSQVEQLIGMISPYLIAKKKQAKIALKILDLNSNVRSREDFLLIARLAYSLSLHNVRSQNRRINNASIVQKCFSRND